MDIFGIPDPDLHNNRCGSATLSHSVSNYQQLDFQKPPLENTYVVPVSKILHTVFNNCGHLFFAFKFNFFTSSDKILVRSFMDFIPFSFLRNNPSFEG